MKQIIILLALVLGSPAAIAAGSFYDLDEELKTADRSKPQLIATQTMPMPGTCWAMPRAKRAI